MSVSYEAAKNTKTLDKFIKKEKEAAKEEQKE